MKTFLAKLLVFAVAMLEGSGTGFVVGGLLATMLGVPVGIVVGTLVTAFVSADKITDYGL